MLLGNQRVNDKGHLEIGGCDTTELAARFGTPLYVLDEAALRQRCREYRHAFERRYSNVEICYAAKALQTVAVCTIIEQEGLSMDVASAGELHVALTAGFPGKRIAMHGNYKSLSELQMALEARIGHINVDNFLEVEMLRELGSPVETLLRVAPGVDPKTHKFIRTGQADSKFGMNLQNGDALEAVRRILDAPNLQLRGFHCHVGSQLLDFESQVAGCAELVQFAAEVRAQTGYAAEMINVGGGIGIRYMEGQRPPTADEYAEALVGTLTSELERHDLGRPKLLLEPGRSIVGEAGITLYTVGPVKQVPARTYVSVDGGLSDNPRPAMYGAVYTAVNAGRASTAQTMEVTIAGKHCETDTLISDARVAPPASGDILAVLSTGAYNYSMASNYNRFLRPAMVLVNDGEAEVIVSRETLDDLTRHDLVPSRFRAV